MTERYRDDSPDYVGIERGLHQLTAADTDISLFPRHREKESGFIRGVDEEGVAYCVGNDGGTTRLVAMTLSDSDYPARIPFTYRPYAVDNFLLRVPGPQLGAFFASYDSPDTSGTIRTVGGTFGNLESEGIRLLASRPQPGFGQVEMGYDMTRAATAAKDIERMLAERMGLFDPDKGLGFRPEHTRGILQVVSGIGRSPILFKPDSLFTISAYDTTENFNNFVPDLKGIQARFRIKIEPLTASTSR